MSCWIHPGFRVASHIRIGIHPDQIALHAVCTHKLPHQRVIVPSVVIIQPTGAVGVLPREALARAYTALLIEGHAIRAIGAVALHRSTSSGVAEAGHHTP